MLRVSQAVANKVDGVIQVEDVRLLAQRSQHFVYAVNATCGDGSRIGLAVRLPKKDNEWRRATQIREHRALQFLEHQGFRYAPKAILYDASLEIVPVPYLIQSYVPSTPLDELSEAHSQQMAIEVAELHDIDGTAFLDADVSGSAPPRRYFEEKMGNLLAYFLRSVDGIFAAAEYQWRSFRS